jgi:RHS repeat-associated protein
MRLDRTSDAGGAHTCNNVNQRQDVGGVCYLDENGNLVCDWRYIYDANGNLTSDRYYNYRWDAANRLVEIESILPVSSGGGGGESSMMMEGGFGFPPPPPPEVTNYTRSRFTYDGLGRRVRITEEREISGDVPSNPPNWGLLSDQRYLWSGDTLVEERDSTGSTVAKRFFAEGEQRTQPSTLDLYYSRDHLGSIRELTDASGAVRAQLDYDPYGMVASSTGNVTSDFGYTGHWHHRTTGLYLTRHRAYSPSMGSWISRDPIKTAEMLPEGPNLYGYVGNNPSNYRDPLGLYVSWPVAAGWAGVAAAGGWGMGTLIYNQNPDFWAQNLWGWLYPDQNPAPAPPRGQSCEQKRRTCIYICQTREGSIQRLTEDFPGQWGNQCPKLETLDPDTGQTVTCDVISGPE